MQEHSSHISLTDFTKRKDVLNKYFGCKKEIMYDNNESKFLTLQKKEWK